MKSLVITIALLAIHQHFTQENMKEISKNNMTVRWKIEQGIIHFEMEAPTNGWIAIGFNETSSLSGTYLLMGRIRNGKVEVVEHYTNKPGSYSPITEYGISSQIPAVSGIEITGKTRLKFSIPTAPASSYHKDLPQGSTV